MPFRSPDISSLQLPQLRLRRYTLDDVDAVYAAIRESIAEISEFLPWCHPNYSRDEVVAWIERQMQCWADGQEFSFIVADPQCGEVLGGCGINQIDAERRRANLGYWVRTSRTGQGLATATTRLLARWGFEQLKLERIEIVAAVGNVASQRVALKAGAIREGVARRRLRIRDRQHDAVCFSLIPDDFQTAEAHQAAAV